MMESTPFTALYKYKLELIKEVKSIKIIIEKARTSIIKFWKLYIKLITNIRFISEKTTIY